MSTTESAPVFVADDNKDLMTAQWASTVWWNGYQQLPLSAAVDNFTYDYNASYDVTSCDDTTGQFYSIPMMDTSANQWPVPVQSATDEEELYVSAAPMSSVVDHHYKYSTTKAAVDYAMLECYAAVGADPTAVSHTTWTSVPYADTTSSISGYEVCCSAPIPAVSMDYCNSLQMMQYGTAFSGFSMQSNKFPTDTDHIRQQCDTAFNKPASTYVDNRSIERNIAFKKVTTFYTGGHYAKLQTL